MSCFKPTSFAALAPHPLLNPPRYHAEGIQTEPEEDRTGAEEEGLRQCGSKGKGTGGSVLSEGPPAWHISLGLSEYHWTAGTELNTPPPIPRRAFLPWVCLTGGRVVSTGIGPAPEGGSALTCGLQAGGATDGGPEAAAAVSLPLSHEQRAVWLFDGLLDDRCPPPWPMGTKFAVKEL